MTQDQVHVPRTRSELGLPPLDPAKEDVFGASIADEVKQELWDALNGHFGRPEANSLDLPRPSHCII